MNRKNKLYVAFVATLTIGVAATAMSGFAENSNYKKARYFYLEGLQRQTEGDNLGAYEYYKKAYEIDSTYEEAASAFGTQRLTLKIEKNQTRDGMLESLKLMQGFVDKYPGDFYESQYYAYVAAQLDTMEESLRIYERESELFPQKTMVLTNLAEARMELGDLKGALEALEKYEKIEGKSSELSLRKISYHLTAQDTIGALSEVKSLVAYNPKEPSYRILQGNVYELLNMPDSALYNFKKAEEIYPEGGMAKLALAGFYQEHGDSVAYDEKIYEAILAEDFNLAQKRTIMADYLQKLISDKSSTERGDHLFNVLRNQYPHDPTILDLSARYNAAKGKTDAAIEEISYAIDLEPEDEGYRAQLVTYYLSKGVYEEAAKAYEKAKKSVTPSPSFRLLYASSLSGAKRIEDAVKEYDSLLKEIDGGLSATDTTRNESIRRSLSYEDILRTSMLYNLVGDTYYSVDKQYDAFKAYEMAIFYYSDNESALNNYAYFLSENDGDLEKALEMSKRSNELSPGNPTFLDTYAWILFQLGRYEEAKTNEQAALEKTGEGEESAELYGHMGDILFMCGDVEGALEYWKKALALEPKDKLLIKKVKHKTYFKE